MIRATHIDSRSWASRQGGLTLVELMVSITLGMLVVLAATALLLSTKAGYVTQDEETRIQDTGRYALEIIGRAVRQAGYENWDSAEAPLVTTAGMSANIAGLDARILNGATNGIESASTKGVVNGSDVLAVRFFGAGNGSDGDGAMVNCAGFGVPAAASPATAEIDRGWSVFYVATASSGVPELYCKYRSKPEPGEDPRWTSTAIASDVESFQVLYGLDTDGDGLPNQFRNASAVDALDMGLGPDKNAQTHWKKVVVVKIALLLRGSQNARPDAATAEYHLFGKDYSDQQGANDAGTWIKEADLPVATRGRPRKLFAATIQLRNHARGDAT